MVNGYEICTSCGSISAIEIPLDVPDVKHLNVLLEVVEKYLEMGSTKSKVFGSTSSSEVLEGISSIVFASSTSSNVFSANPSQNPF